MRIFRPGHLSRGMLAAPPLSGRLSPLDREIVLSESIKAGVWFMT